MVLTLYKMNASPPSRSVLMTIEALGIKDVEYVDVNTLAGDHLTEEFLKINPEHTIPVLQDDDFLICESHAIVAYLVNEYAEDKSLYPEDHQKRALVDQRLHLDNGTLFAALKEAVEPILYGGAVLYDPESLDKFKYCYSILNKLLTNDYITGDQITIADICCIATVSSMNAVLRIDATEYPNLISWMGRCAQQEFYQKKNVSGLRDMILTIKKKMSY